MKGMILAAGEGTRLKPLTCVLPKPMIPVLNRPVMEYLVRHLVNHNFNTLFINLHYLPETIERYFGNGEAFGVNIVYSKEEKLLGTAGSVKRLASQFNETFLVIGGDDLTDTDVTRIVSYHKEKKAKATIGLKEVKDVSQYGVVILNADGKITAFQEKPMIHEAKSNLANTGIYIFEPEILELIPENSFYDFGRQLFPLLLERGIPFYGFIFKDFWLDIGSLAEYKEAHWDILNKNTSIIPAGREISPNIWAEDRVEIANGAKLIPPIVIGAGTKINDGAMIAGPISIGRNVIIEKKSKIKKSILWDTVTVKESSVITDCVIGSKVVVPPNQIFYQCVFNQQEIVSIQ